MEYPFGHHHHRPDPNEEHPHPNPNPYPNPYPPPAHNPYPPPANNPYGYPQPPPPQYYPAPPPAPFVQHVTHEVGPGGYDYPPPPPSVHQEVGPGGYDFPRPPPVHHVGHEVGPGGYGAPPPPSVHHMSHEGSGGGYANRADHNQQHHHWPSFFPHREEHQSGPHGEGTRQQTVRIYTKADDKYSLSIRDGQVVLAPKNPADEYQHWIKDLRYSTKVKDEEHFPGFALVNKVTGEAIKHSIGATHPVRLIKYNPDYLDESVLWSESKDLGDGFRCIRMVNNIRLNFDAFHGDEDHGGVRDGTTLVLWEWLKGKNQRWKIVPYLSIFPHLTAECVPISSGDDVLLLQTTHNNLWLVYC